MTSTDQHWREKAANIQTNYWKTIPGARWKTYEKSEWDFIEKRIAFHLYGAPTKDIPSNPNLLLGDYSSEANKTVGKIVNKLAEKLGGEKPLEFESILICYNEADAPNKVAQDTIFRVVNLKSCEFLIDRESRIYKDWDFFLKTNKIPLSDMCVPSNGVYSTNCNNFLQLDFLPSATGYNLLNIIRQVDSVFGKIMSNVAMEALRDVRLSELTVQFWSELQLSVSLTDTAGILIISIAGWCVLKMLGRVVDRVQHEQSLNILKKDGLENWAELLKLLMADLFGILSDLMPFGSLIKVTIKTASERVMKFIQQVEQLAGSSGTSLNHMLNLLLQYFARITA